MEHGRQSYVCMARNIEVKARISEDLIRVEEGVEGGGEFGAGPILLADDFAGDAAVAADEIGFGNHHGAVIGADFPVVVAVGGEIDLMFGQEFLIRGGVVVPTDANHRSALAGN